MLYLLIVKKRVDRQLRLRRQSPASGIQIDVERRRVTDDEIRQ